MDHKEREAVLRRHESLDYIGLRAQATMVGLMELCSELASAGVLSGEALERIKDAIAKDVLVSRRGIGGRGDVETALRTRLDAIFPCGPSGKTEPVGTAADLQSAIGVEPGTVSSER